MPTNLFDVILEFFPGPGDLIVDVQNPRFTINAIDTQFNTFTDITPKPLQFDLNSYVELRRLEPPYKYYLLDVEIQTTHEVAALDTRYDGIIHDRDAKSRENVFWITDDGIVNYQPAGNYLNNILRLHFIVGDELNFPNQAAFDLSEAYQMPDDDDEDEDDGRQGAIGGIGVDNSMLVDGSINNNLLLGFEDNRSQFWQSQGVDSNCALTTLSSLLMSLGFTNLTISELIRIASTEIIVDGEPLISANTYFPDDGTAPVPPIGMQDLYGSTIGAMLRNLNREGLPQEWTTYIEDMFRYKISLFNSPRAPDGLSGDFYQIISGIRTPYFYQPENLDALEARAQNRLIDPSDRVDELFSENQLSIANQQTFIENDEERLDFILESNNISGAITFQDLIDAGIDEIDNLTFKAMAVKSLLESKSISTSMISGLDIIDIALTLRLYTSHIQFLDELMMQTRSVLESDVLRQARTDIQYIEQLKGWLNADATIPDNMRFGSADAEVEPVYRLDGYNPAAKDQAWNVINIVFDHFDVPHHTGYATDPFTMIVSELEAMNNIAIFVDAGELWTGDVLEVLTENSWIRSGENHIVWITGVEVGADGETYAILNDSSSISVEEGAGIRVPLKVLYGAWEDSEYAYTATGETAPTRDLQIQAQKLNIVAHNELGREPGEVVNVLKLDDQQLEQINDENPGFLVEVGRLKSDLQTERARILEKYGIDAEEAQELAGRLDIE